MLDENFKLSNEQLTMYLDRLGIELLEPTAENLVQLQTIHISKIPYENLSILLGEPISLDGNDLFRKIILNQRGGYCFEVNGLYSFLLKALGYKVTSLNTRFIYDDKGVQVRRHRIMRVDFSDLSYITDASFRLESPRKALKFQYELVQSDGIAEYKFTKDDYYTNILWQRLSNGEWKKVFGFDESPQSETDFILANYYCETHSDSPFINYPIISLFPAGRHIIISNRTLTIYTEENVPTRQNIDSNNDLLYYIKKYFSIELSEYDIKKFEEKEYCIP